MPSNDEHREGGRPVAILLALALPIVLYWWTEQIVYTALGAIPLLIYPVAIGIPDIDSESSIPRRHLRKAIIGVSVLSLGYVAYTNLSLVTGIIAAQVATITPQTAVLVVALGVVGGGVGVGRLADKKVSDLLPPHRDILHNPAAYLLGGGVGIFAVDVIYLRQLHSFVRAGVLVLLISALIFALTHIVQDKIHD